MELYEEIFLKHPNFVNDFLDYFVVPNEIKNEFRTPYYFCEKYNYKYNLFTVDNICKKLEREGFNVIKTLRLDGTPCNNTYSIFIPDYSKNKSRHVLIFSSIIYGFRYIYEYYRNLVVPIEVKTESDDYSLGTGFLTSHGIATAKHCLIDGKEVSIKGFSKEILENSNIWISNNNSIDLAYIELENKSFPNLYMEGKVLDNILALGYPKLPFFKDFLNGETAQISSIYDLRQTPTTGQISSIERSYFNEKLMLITAKIKGGNSGGPIINSYGAVVGISFEKVSGEGNYDDLGYGIAYPIDLLLGIINNKPKNIKGDIKFYNFPN